MLLLSGLSLVPNKVSFRVKLSEESALACAQSLAWLAWNNPKWIICCWLIIDKFIMEEQSVLTFCIAVAWKLIAANHRLWPVWRTTLLFAPTTDPGTVLTLPEWTHVSKIYLLFLFKASHLFSLYLLKVISLISVLTIGLKFHALVSEWVPAAFEEV